MKIFTLLFITASISIHANAQSNLVPFGDFEGIVPHDEPSCNCNTVCNEAVFNFQSTSTSWTAFGITETKSPNLFSADNSDCQSSFGVPINNWGTQHPAGGVTANRNYVGLESSATERDGIRVRLKHKLLSGHQYVLRFLAVKKSNLDPEIEFRIGRNDTWEQGSCPSCSQSFMTIGADGGSNDDQWQNYSVSFIPDDCDYEWLMIRLKLNPGTRRILIDNITIDDPCGEAFLCGDYGNLDNITVNGLHNANLPLTFFHLENVENFHLTIRLANGQTVATRFVPYPPSTYQFDGRNDQGVLLPFGNYTFTLVANNSCQCMKVINAPFAITGTPQLSAFVGFDFIYGVLTVYKLNDVTHLHMRISDALGNDVRIIDIINPANQVAWDGRNATGSYVATGLYHYDIITESPCGDRFFSDNFTQLNLTQATQFSPNIDYSSYPKIVSCSGDNSYDEAPPACCGFIVDWYISDRHIGGLQDYKINHDIVAVQNNVVDAGSDIYFQAGNEIVFYPEFEVEYGAEFEAVILPCAGRLMNPELIGTENESDSVVEIANVNRELGSRIFPNPSSGEFILELDSLSSDAITISISDISGRVVYEEQVNNPRSSKMQVLIDISALGSGIYLCSVKEQGRLKTVNRIVVQ